MLIIFHSQQTKRTTKGGELVRNLHNNERALDLSILHNFKLHYCACRAYFPWKQFGKKYDFLLVLCEDMRWNFSPCCISAFLAVCEVYFSEEVVVWCNLIEGELQQRSAASSDNCSPKLFHPPLSTIQFPTPNTIPSSTPFLSLKTFQHQFCFEKLKGCCPKTICATLEQRWSWWRSCFQQSHNSQL